MLHPELLDPDDFQAISRDVPRLDHAEAASKLLRLRPESPITVKSGPGFLVNRILLPMINEAFFMLAKGDASATEIDEGMTLGCNHRWVRWR
jgi:3-hydroxyacyl-CoA dehydrogenase